MDNYTPDELRDLPNMKRRVMQNVLENVTNTQEKRSFNIKFTVLTAAFTLGICLFVGNEVWKNKELLSSKVANHEIDEDPTEKIIANNNDVFRDELTVDYWKRGSTANTDIEHNSDANPAKDDKDTDHLVNPDNPDENVGEGSSGIAPRDFTRPKITVSNNKFSIEGVSIGDTVEKVTSILGNNYIIPEDAIGEFVITYDNIAHFTFEKNKLIEVILIDVNKEYYDKFYNASQLIKIEMESETMNLLYIKNTEEIIKSEEASKTKLKLYLMVPGPEFYHYYPEYKN